MLLLKSFFQPSYFFSPSSLLLSLSYCSYDKSIVSVSLPRICSRMTSCPNPEAEETVSERLRQEDEIQLQNSMLWFFSPPDLQPLNCLIFHDSSPPGLQARTRSFAAIVPGPYYCLCWLCGSQEEHSTCVPCGQMVYGCMGGMCVH